ncbi:helix-turn-helix domain-containing protein [Acidothermaceae bacterium B102]|nr:helix-turn-helix domain-containing protein [Acidothermaceae bacterium B102]
MAKRGTEAAALTEVARLAGRDSAVDPEMIGDYLTSVVGAVRSSRRLTSDDLDQATERGAAAARAGVAVGPLVDLHLSAVWRLWPQLPEMLAPASGRRPDVADQALFALRAADDGVAALVSGYDRELRALASREAAAHQEFLDDLLAGQTDVATLVERGAQFGLRLGGYHRVVVVRGSAVGDASSHQLERQVQALVGADDAVVAAKGSDLIAVLPDRGAAANASDEGELTAFGARLLGNRRSRTAFGPGVRVGVGRCLPGPGGVRTSWLEAQDSLTVAAALDLTDLTVTADRTAAHRMLLQDPHALAQLVESVLAPLRGVRGGPRALVDTLVVHLATDSTAETARRLHLSVRATTYRLQRIVALTGRDLHDPTDRFALQSAAVGARLLGWS